MLKCCLIRDPKQRVSFPELLAHPYVQVQGHPGNQVAKGTTKEMKYVLGQLVGLNSPNSILKAAKTLSAHYLQWWWKSWFLFIIQDFGEKNGEKNDLQLLINCQVSPVKYTGLLDSWVSVEIYSWRQLHSEMSLAEEFSGLSSKENCKKPLMALYVLNCRMVFSFALPWLVALGLSCSRPAPYLRLAGSLVAACMWDLIPRPGIEPRPPALGARSPKHCATREVPCFYGVGC